MSRAPSIEQSVIVVVAIVILEEDMAHLEVVVVPMVVNRLLVIKGSGNVSIA